MCFVCVCVHETAYTNERRYGSSQRDIPLVMFPRTFLSPFVSLSLCSLPHITLLARHFHVYVEVTNVRAFVFQLSGCWIYGHCPSLVSWNHEGWRVRYVREWSKYPPPSMHACIRVYIIAWILEEKKEWNSIISESRELWNYTGRATKKMVSRITM